jgi:hypothetical protein
MRINRFKALFLGAMIAGSIAAVVLREIGASRTAYFPGDIECNYWLTGHDDLKRCSTTPSAGLPAASASSTVRATASSRYAFQKTKPMQVVTPKVRLLTLQILGDECMWLKKSINR